MKAKLMYSWLKAERIKHFGKEYEYRMLVTPISIPLTEWLLFLRGAIKKKTTKLWTLSKPPLKIYAVGVMREQEGRRSSQ